MSPFRRKAGALLAPGFGNLWIVAARCRSFPPDVLPPRRCRQYDAQIFLPQATQPADEVSFFPVPECARDAWWRVQHGFSSLPLLGRRLDPLFARAACRLDSARFRCRARRCSRAPEVVGRAGFPPRIPAGGRCAAPRRPCSPAARRNRPSRPRAAATDPRRTEERQCAAQNMSSFRRLMPSAVAVHKAYSDRLQAGRCGHVQLWRGAPTHPARPKPSKSRTRRYGSFAQVRRIFAVQPMDRRGKTAGNARRFQVRVPARSLPGFPCTRRPFSFQLPFGCRAQSAGGFQTHAPGLAGASAECLDDSPRQDISDARKQMQ